MSDERLLSSNNLDIFTRNTEASLRIDSSSLVSEVKQNLLSNPDFCNAAAKSLLSINEEIGDNYNNGKSSLKFFINGEMYEVKTSPHGVDPDFVCLSKYSMEIEEMITIIVQHGESNVGSGYSYKKMFGSKVVEILLNSEEARKKILEFTSFS